MCDQHQPVEKPETFWIPEHHEATLKVQVTKFNKKADKLNCPHITYHILGSKSVAAKGYEERAEFWGKDEVPHVTMIEVEVIGQAPKIEGWKFLGTLDRYSLPGAVIINTVPGEQIPEQFHTADASCDHCGKIRRRNETFVLQEDETGDYKRVGRQCVRDFIGYDPKAIMRYMRSLLSFSEQFADEEKYGFGGSGQRFMTFSHIDVLTKTAALIDKYGWVPKSAANEEHSATASDVLQVYFPPDSKYHQAYAAWKKWREELNLDDPKWRKEAEAARAWLKEQTGTGEYWHNLHAIDQAEGVPTHLFGYWCSVMSGYQRAMEKLRLAEREPKLNEHVGDVKERRDFNVKLKKRRSFEGAYGTVRLHEFRDEDGRTLIWWANVDPEMELDGQYRIKGTIKKHDEREGWKQTVLTRVKVIEEVEQEQAA
jgi:hypothetical protein